MSGKASDRKGKRKKAGPFSVGELNKLVDGLCHPLFKEDAGFILVDGFLHGLVERNPPTSVKKFVKYNLPKLIEESLRKSEKKKRKSKKIEKNDH